VAGPVRWDEASAAHVKTRSQRYRGAVDIKPAWTQEVFDDPNYVAFEPDPKSRVGGHGSSAIRRRRAGVLVVIAYCELDGELCGVNAWPATGDDLRVYDGGLDGDDD
jgi:hypothetical protein